MNNLCSKILSTDNIVFFSGAGISTESGVPDFRSPGGIWTKYQPVYYQDFVSNKTDRIRYWKMKKETHELYKQVGPNAGHLAITEFEKHHKLSGLITQNIDGLHHLAKTSKNKIVEIHGSDKKIVCLECDFNCDAEEIFKNIPDTETPFEPPLCPECKGLLKPSTISFGQTMPFEEMRVAHEWSEQAKVFIVLGSSLQVQPAASFPVIAKRKGAYLAIINRDPTPLDDLADFVHNGEIGSFMKSLVENLFSQEKR